MESFKGWTKDTTLEDIMKDPAKYGVPTYDDFKRNRSKYMGSNEDKFNEVERGSQTFGRVAKRYLFEIEGYRCKTLHEVERIAQSQGIPIKELNYTAELIPIGGGQADMLVKFMSSEEKNRRDGILRG